MNLDIEQATLGGGCFWCLEAVFQRVVGVTEVIPGYAGGETPDPSYEQVCSGTTGHAEVVQVFFNPGQITFEEVLEVFWHIHDPTTLNRQGADVGSQYRSVIFYHTEQQKEKAQESIRRVSKSGLWPDPVVTELAPLKTFYPAEAYHRNYYNQHPDQAYCSMVISPKLQKFLKKFPDKLK